VYSGALAGGTGNHAMKLPLGTTGTLTPLIVRAALPLPTVPKMKFESRA
jgi:hypothetical protein